MSTPARPRPTREEFAALWHDAGVTVVEICRRLRISDTTCAKWARRWGLRPRTSGGFRPPSKAPPIILKHGEDHCREVLDGPGPGDPTPEEIRELAAYCRARRVVAGETAYVYIQQPAEDLAWVA